MGWGDTGISLAVCLVGRRFAGGGLSGRSRLGFLSLPYVVGIERGFFVIVARGPFFGGDRTDSDRRGLRCFGALASIYWKFIFPFAEMEGRTQSVGVAGLSFDVCGGFGALADRGFHGESHD